jgi:C4-dicarboxylate-specific signal transduction histidine kinase
VLNAAEAMGAVEARPRELPITTEQTEANGVLVAVRDFGLGIDPEHVEGVSTPLHNEVQRSGDGVGDLPIHHRWP